MLLAVVCCACERAGGARPSLWSAQEVVGARNVVTTAWDTVATFGGSGSDAFGELWLIAMAPGRVYVFDNVDQRLHAFSDGLAPLWAFGVKGSGPGEFRMVRSLGVDKLGDAVLLDVELRRITVVGADGKLRYSTQLQRGAEQAVPLGRDSFVVFDPHDDDAILSIVDSAGEDQVTIPMPWDGYTKLDRLVRSGVYLQGFRGSSWVAAFSNGNGWFSFTGAKPESFVGKYIEHTDFPLVKSTKDARLMVQPEYSAQSLSVSDSLLYVLFAGLSDKAYRLIDEYDLRNGSYRGTLELPKPVAGIAQQDGDVYVVFNTPYPTIQRLRPLKAASDSS